MDTDTLRRLSRLRTRRTLTDKSDEYLTMLLEDSRDYFLSVTHRSADPGARADSIITRIAVMWSNMEGGEGAKHVKDGEVEREYPEATMPEDIEREIKAWKLVVGVDAVSGNRSPPHAAVSQGRVRGLRDRRCRAILCA